MFRTDLCYAVRPLVKMLIFNAFCFFFFFFQTSNGNDPWAVFDNNPSGGFSNNWAAQPEGTETGKTSSNAWHSGGHGHPQAYQGPGNPFSLNSWFFF